MKSSTQFSLAGLFLLTLAVAAVLAAWKSADIAGVIGLACWIPFGMLVYWISTKPKSTWLRLVIGIFSGTLCGAALAGVDRITTGPDPMYPSGLIAFVGFGAIVGLACGICTGLKP